MVPTPYDPVFDAIQTYLGTSAVAGEWDQSLARLVYENEPDDAPTDAPAPWVAVVLETQLYGQESIGGGQGAGDNRWDEEGILWFHVMIPRGTGSREARRIAKALANMFRGKRLLSEYLEFGDADMGAGDPGKENGNYYLLSVSIGWGLTEAQ